MYTRGFIGSIADSEPQSIKFWGLIFSRLKTGIVNLGSRGRNPKIYGIFGHQPRPKDEGLLRCGTRSVSKALKGFVALACINSLNQTNIIDDSVWQSCIFKGLFFDWFNLAFSI